MNKKMLSKSNTVKKHICQECGSSFNRPYRLLQHTLLHKNIKIFACGEENCNKSYSSKSHLDRHIHTVHIKPILEVTYRCPVCMKVFANRQNLKRHIKVKHDKKKRFVCDVCNSEFKKKHLLSAHMYHHTFVKSFSCDYCDREFATLLEKKKHLKIHKTHNCEFCDMAFNHWSKYQKHKQTEHNTKEFICNDCKRVFKKRHHIVRHVKIHMSLPVFKCWYKDCKRLYSTNSNLRQHIRIKHMNITQPCEICGAQLATKSSLKVHLKTHIENGVTIRQPTIIEGRKRRKDKGSLKTNMALKLAGLFVPPDISTIENYKEDTHNYVRNTTSPIENGVKNTSDTKTQDIGSIIEANTVYSAKVLSVDKIDKAESIDSDNIIKEQQNGFLPVIDKESIEDCEILKAKQQGVAFRVIT